MSSMIIFSHIETSFWHQRDVGCISNVLIPYCCMAHKLICLCKLGAVRPAALGQFICDLIMTPVQCCVAGFQCCVCVCVKRLRIFYQNKTALRLTRTDYVNDVLAALIPLGFEMCLLICAWVCVCVPALVCVVFVWNQAQIEPFSPPFKQSLFTLRHITVMMIVIDFLLFFMLEFHSNLNIPLIMFLQ